MSRSAAHMLAGIYSAIDLGPVFDFTAFGQRDRAEEKEHVEGARLALDEAAQHIVTGKILGRDD